MFVTLKAGPRFPRFHQQLFQNFRLSCVESPQLFLLKAEIGRFKLPNIEIESTDENSAQR